MCGLVGAVSSTIFTDQEDLILRNLLIVDSLRGEDGTGVIVTTAKKKAYYFKRPGHPFNLFDAFDSKGLWGPNKIFIGHNRRSTMGANTYENTHPFNFKKVCGVHNGTLRTEDINRLLGMTKESVLGERTDSELLYKALSENSLQDVWSNLAGAAALVWWDSGKQTLNFIRNGQRPFTFLFPKYGGAHPTIYWASEPWMVRSVIKKIKKFEETFIEKELPVNVHMSVKENKSGFLNWESRPVEPCKQPFTMYYNWGSFSPATKRRMAKAQRRKSAQVVVQ